MAFLIALRRLLVDDTGQDLIEYALLSAFIGFAGVSAFNVMGSAMQTAYTSWVTHANSNSCVEMPDPGAAITGC